MANTAMKNAMHHDLSQTKIKPAVKPWFTETSVKEITPAVMSAIAHANFSSLPEGIVRVCDQQSNGFKCMNQNLDEMSWEIKKSYRIGLIFFHSKFTS